MDKVCAWCYKPTNMPKTFAAKSPILDWLESKIDKWCEDNNKDREDLWGEFADWDELEISEEFEMELLTYDELINTIEKKRICKECLNEDDKLWKIYYMDPFDDDEDDLELDIEDIQ